jgi:hypothetical protein
MQQKGVAFEEQTCYNDVASKERCADTGQKTAALLLALTIHCFSVAAIHIKYAKPTPYGYFSILMVGIQPLCSKMIEGFIW